MDENKLLTKKEIKKAQKKRDEQHERGIALLNSFRDELVTIFYKSQDSFEKQLSFITAGSLGLSVGFIKDIVTPFNDSIKRGFLGWGWGLLILTLLLNCVSHLIAAGYSNRAIKEINENRYEPEKINVRNKIILNINRFTVGTMIAGITLIIIFITINTLL